MKKLIIDISSKTSADSKYNDVMDYPGSIKSYSKGSTDYSLSKRSPEGSSA
jgi:hypothetical protein